MRAASSILLTLLLLAGSMRGPAVAGPVLDDDTLEERVRQAAEDLLTDRFPDYAERIGVRVVRVRAVVEDTDALTVRLPALEGIPRGHTQVRVVRHSDAGPADAGWAVLHVSHFDSVAVAQRDFSREEAVTAGDVGTAWIDVTRFRGRPLDLSTVQALRAGDAFFVARPVKSGEILRPGDLRPPYAAQTGESLTMTYRRGPVALKVPCRARESGAAGDVIRVYSDATKTLYKARLGEGGTAEWVATL